MQFNAASEGAAGAADHKERRLPANILLEKKCVYEIMKPERLVGMLALAARMKALSFIVTFKI